MTAAALGTSIELETLDGPRTVDIKSGTQSGESVTLPGLGVQHLRGAGRGELFVHIEVQTPTRLDAEQEDLLRRLAALRGEEGANGKVMPEPGLFARLRDAFNGR
jgi:molecular chaperone DnaJ